MTLPFEPAKGEGRRVLIVDDDEGILTALATFFQRIGYDVVKAATGQQGLEAFRNQEPDVTILDLRLPDIDGLQVLEVMHQKRAAVVLLTGFGDIATAVQAMKLGAENFLTKPVDLPHLVAVVERAIEKADLRRENQRLRAYVPTSRKRTMRVLTVIAMLVAAGALGLLVGGIGVRERPVPEIAPTRQPVNAPRMVRPDTLPFAPAPAPTTAPARSR
jgi:DNA-binding NtrC family response regulator